METPEQIIDRDVAAWDNVKAAIEYKGVPVGNIPVEDYPSKIKKISGWQPDPEWPDIRDSKVAPQVDGYEPRFTVLLADSDNNIQLSALGGEYYITSDGYRGLDTFHTFMPAWDFFTSSGYRVRWVTVYTAVGNRDVALNYSNVFCLWVYLRDCNVTNFTFGGSTEALGNSLIESIQCSSSTTSSPNCLLTTPFYFCRSLAYIQIPEGCTTLGNNCFDACISLHEIILPSTITTFNANAFSYCRSLVVLNIPSSVTSIDINAFIGLNSLLSIRVTQNYLPPATGIVVSTVAGNTPRFMSISGMKGLAQRLANNVGKPAKNITLGSANINRLSTIDRALFTNKNYILS